MSQQYPKQFQPPQPPAPKVKKPMRREARIGWAILIGAVLFIAGVTVGAAANPQASPATALGDPAPTTTVTVTAPAEPEVTDETTEPPAAVAPAPADFTLTPKTLSKECFGSAGCVLTYTIVISYTGPTLAADDTYTVIYDVRGGLDGTVTNTFTITGDTSSVDSSESIQTKSTKTKLTAVVTDVMES